jgi:hypothetical protein
VCAILLMSASVAAQVRIVRYDDDRLKGIGEVDVLVLQSSSQGACRVSRPTLQNRALGALRERGVAATVSEKARSWYYSVVIEIHSGSQSSVCASAVSTELVAEVAGIPEADNAAPPGSWGSFLVGGMALLKDKTLVIGTALEHDAAVQQAVEAQVAAVAARIRSANP